MDEKVAPILALERCEVYLAHICALTHLKQSKASQEEDVSEECRDEILCIVKNLGNDLAILKSAMEDDESA